MNLRQIKIPNANLIGVFFSGSDLAKADLSNVNFTSAYLENCNFEGALMRDIQLGIYPDLNMLYSSV